MNKLNKDTFDLIKKVVFSHVDSNKYKVFIFGSRASGKSNRFSDVDIGIKGDNELPGHVVEAIRGDFEETSLPYFVDVVDFSNVSKDFEKLATTDTIYIN